VLFIFKTDYEQDIRLFKHGGQVFWYSVLGVVLLAAPWWASEYLLSQLHFIGIYSIVGLGLMLLVGFTGQISLGHAAFLAVGAYTEALLQAAGWPFWLTLPCAALLSAAVGQCLASSLLFCMGKAHLEPQGLEAEVLATTVRNPEGRLRVGGIRVRLMPAVTPEVEARMQRCLEVFESFCLVTESVRAGIDVQVAVEPRVLGPAVTGAPVTGRAATATAGGARVATPGDP